MKSFELYFRLAILILNVVFLIIYLVYKKIAENPKPTIIDISSTSNTTNGWGPPIKSPMNSPPYMSEAPPPYSMPPPV